MGGGALYAPPSLAFCLLLKISWGKQYLKIIDLANLFVADVPMKMKEWKNLVITLSEHFENIDPKTARAWEGLKEFVKQRDNYV